MTGNCLKGSRPLLYFDKGFDEAPAMKVAKELLQQCFNVCSEDSKDASMSRTSAWSSTSSRNRR